jgi:autophagy-related protein 9
MMTSNILSRLLPSNPPARSIYDDLRAHDEASESDVEEQAGMALDEENLGFHDDELRNADVFNGEDSRITTESTAFLGGQQPAPTNDSQRRKAQKGRSRWFAQSPRLLEEDGDDDVPASLLIEGHDNPGLGAQNPPRNRQIKVQAKEAAIPGSSNRETRAHWEAAQAQQRLHRDQDAGIPGGPLTPQPKISLLTGSSREKAMWRWINVTNIDNFIKDVYDYYTGSGIWCIVLTRVLELL